MSHSDTRPGPRSSRSIRILMAEDSAGDQFMVREALAETKFASHLHFVNNGEEALAFLRRTGAFTDAPRPDLVLLDLHMPRKGGDEVLAEIKRDENLKQIPVIILTTSQAERDVSRVYELSANWYITKPVNHEQFVKMIQGIESFWNSVVTLPTHGNR